MTDTQHSNLTTTSESTPATLATRDDDTNVIDGVRNAIHRLSGPNATADDFLTVQHVIAGMKQVVRDLDATAKEAGLEFLTEHGEVVSGDERYYVGKKKTTKCRDTGKALEALLTETGGDFEAVVELMKSEPWKYGACKGVLGDDWNRYFMVVESETVEKEVKRIDTRFEKGRK